MPTYEYECTACGNEFERDQRISEDPIKKCPKCGKQKAKRLISRTSFVLKGGGWYSDLYGSAKPKSESKGDSAKESTPASASDSSAAKTDAASGSESKTDSKGDSKPDAKTEKKADKKKSSKGKAAA